MNVEMPKTMQAALDLLHEENEILKEEIKYLQEEIRHLKTLLSRYNSGF